MLHRIVLVDILLDDAQQVLSVAEERADTLDGVLVGVDILLAVTASNGLNTAYAGSHTALAENLEESDATRAGSVNTAAELA